MKTYIDICPKYGRGVYAAQEFQPGDRIAIEELLVLSEQDTIKVNETDLNQYTFKFNEKQDCLVLGSGELYNHHDNPNVGYRVTKFGDRHYMWFFALERIEPRDQLFIDYSSDCLIDMKTYKGNLFS